MCVCTWDCVIIDMSSIRQGSLSKVAARSSRVEAEQTTKPSNLVVDGGGGGSSSSSVSMRITRRRQSVWRSRSLQGDAI